jgi:glycerol dehydrogenase
MDISTDYLPHAIFAPGDREGRPLPRVFIAPQRYIQGPGVLTGIGRYLSVMQPKRVALLMSERGLRHEGVRLVEGLRSADIESVECIFGGECSSEEIASQVDALAQAGVDCVIAAGGGKCVDTGKAVAHRLGTPIVVVPTLASNDAPCSAVSVLYTSEGVSTGVEFYPCNPAFVVVDTEIIAAAPERYLVAGMGDAMATWYEARVCLLNAAAVTTVGARPTLASSAIGEICAQTLFEHGRAAAAAVAANAVDDSLEAVVEANTLLSGVGFESGGLAAAHGIAQSYTGITKVRSNYLHGEMVAMGTLAQLMLESRPEETARVAEFFASVGLPVHLGQLSLDVGDSGALDTVVEGTFAFPYIGNMPHPITAEALRSAILGAHQIGESVAAKSGDGAYRRLQRG